MKLGIVGGAGLLGSTTAFVLGMRDVVEEIKLVDLNENAAKNQAMDMGQAILPFSATKITAAGYADLGDCEVILLQAGPGCHHLRQPGGRVHLCGLEADGIRHREGHRIFLQ